MLASAAEARTVLDDWLVRRQRLAASESIREPHRRMQLQVLEYLIRRYADSPDAARPARCPSTAAFYSNDRLIVVHHHLGRGRIAGVRNQAEANRRVGDILGHLRRVHEDDAEAVAAHNDFASWVDELDQRPDTPVSAWRDICRQLKPGRRTTASLHRAIAASLKQSPYLPRAVLAYLCRRLSEPKYDIVAAELLLSCRSETVPDYVARAWRERVNRGCLDGVTEKLRAHLVSTPRALDAIRQRLADTDPAVRLAATQLLRDAGTLDDVALLSDLVSLPRSADEHSYERGALLDAMWTIAHRD
ncbi:MAG TPA: hypothetical protein PK867_19525 [Pirellulales bacterium]|nr:hypothetical protein [Pirellulales bacterium]